MQFGPRALSFKLKQNGICGKLLIILPEFLKDRKQRITLNGEVSPWKSVTQESLKDQF